MDCSVYRTFNSLGRLLYVGVAVDPVARFKVHRHAGWYPAVRAVHIEWHDDRKAALAVERAAIAAEWPLWNVKDSPMAPGRRRPRHIEFLTRSPLGTPERERDFCSALIHQWWVERLVVAAFRDWPAPPPLAESARAEVVDSESMWRIWNAWNDAYVTAGALHVPRRLAARHAQLDQVEISTSTPRRPRRPRTAAA